MRFPWSRNTQEEKTALKISKEERDERKKTAQVTLDSLLERLNARNAGAAKQLLAKDEFERLLDLIADYGLQGYKEKLEDAYKIAQDILQYEKTAHTLRKLLTVSVSAESTSDMLSAYVAFYDAIMQTDELTRTQFCSEYSLEESSLAERLHEVALGCRNELLHLRDEQDIRSFDQFVQGWTHYAIPGLDYPEDWNHRVAWLVVDPEITLFKGVETEVDVYGGYQLSLRAAQAWKANDITGIMIALARSQASDRNNAQLHSIYLDLCVAANELRPHLEVPRY